MKRFAFRAPSRPTWRLFLGTLLCSFLAKGAALQQGFGLDDYGFALEETQAGVLFWQARIGGGLLDNLLQTLQFDPVHSQFVWSAAFITIWALLGTLVARYWHLHREGWIAFAVATLVAIHPYGCDSLHMRSALSVAAPILVAVALLLIPERWTPRRLAGGTLLVAVAVSINQLTLHYLLMVVLVSTAVGWGRTLAWASSRGWPSRARRLVRPGRIVRHKTTALVACALGGTAVYAAVAQLYISWRHLKLTQRTQLLPLAAAGERGRQVWRWLGSHLAGPEALLTPIAKALLLVALAVALLGLLRQLRWPSPGRSLAAALVVLAALGAALPGTLGLLLVLREFWPAPRVIAPVAIFWAGVVALAYLLHGEWVRRALAVLVSVVLVSFVGIDNRVFSEQLRLNRRDALLANRIVMRLETAPGFSAASRLVMSGKPAQYTLPFLTQTYDTNVSALRAEWSKRQIVREISGYRLATPSAVEVAAAAAYCAQAQPFPAPDSVVVQDGLAIVCLGGSD